MFEGAQGFRLRIREGKDPNLQNERDWYWYQATLCKQ